MGLLRAFWDFRKIRYMIAIPHEENFSLCVAKAKPLAPNTKFIDTFPKKQTQGSIHEIVKPVFNTSSNI